MRDIIRSLLVIFIFSFCFGQQSTFPPANIDYKFHRVNEVLYTKTNFGNTRSNITVENLGSDYAQMEIIFPQGTINAFKLASGFWVGAIVGKDTLVTSSAGYESRGSERGYTVETYPDFSKNDTIYYSSSLFKSGSNDIEAIDSRNFFTENGLLHPDYYPVSHEDLICQYYDNKINKYTAESPEILKSHEKLDLHIIERTMAWNHPSHDQTIFIEYFFINESDKNWTNASFALIQDPNIGTSEYLNWTNDYIYYDFDHQAIIFDNDPRGDDDLVEDAKVGMVILGGSFEDSDLQPKYMFHQWEHGPYDALYDSERYQKLVSGEIGVMGSPDLTAHQNGILGYGPLENIASGDTLHIFAALVGGRGETDLLDRIDKARNLYATKFRLPSPPNPPQFTLIPGDHSVTIDWSWQEEYYDNGFPPEESYDKARADSNFYDFEGYRIYRSSTGEYGPWHMVAEFDSLNGNGYEIGLQYKFKDKGLVNGLTYYYAVTAFDQRDYVTGEGPYESPLSVSKKYTVPGPSLSENEKDNKPYVVPNPYRADVDYTSNPEWEYSTSIGRNTWYEIDRRLAFLNLPQRCNIKIFTIEGYLVNEIDHDKDIKGHNVAYWNLLNKNNHTVGSGIYYFVVRDNDSKKNYVDKFVIVK